MATIRQRGTAWQLNWSDAQGQHRVSLGKISKREAEIKCREKELELATGRRYGSAGVSFAAFAIDYLQWYAVTWPSTYKRTEGIIRYQLDPAFGLMDLDTISPQDVTRWIMRRSTEVKPATVTKEARALQAILRKAVEWRVISGHMLAGHKPPPERASKSPMFYSKEQLQALYEASPNHAEIWRLFVNTGMRRNEALYLKLDDIKADALMIESREEAPTKSRRWREVPLNEGARHAIRMLRFTSAPTAYLLPRVAPPSLSRAFATCAARANLPGSLHSLRHTFISHLAMAGIDVGTIQRLAGHASITTTMRYMHLAPGHARKAVQAIAL
jgi:integrase